MWAAGVKTIRNILMTFVIIGFLTGLWRAGGTIPTIVYYASGVIDPALIVLLTFVLNCLLSFLMGTSFGTAATMGLISMTIASTLGASKAARWRGRPVGNLLWGPLLSRVDKRAPYGRPDGNEPL